MTKQLMLIVIKPYKGKDGSQKYKYLFLDEKNEVFEGYSHELKHESELVDQETFDAARARAWEVSRDSFNGVLSTRVDV